MIVTAKDFKLTPSITEYANQKFGALERLSRQPITDIKVMLDVDHNQRHGNVCRVEGSAVWRGRTYKAGEKATEMHEAIDICVEKLERQLRDAKERLISKRAGHHGLT
ncbi:MAG: ribosome-associated translation inhibitor RaiA [bacterium]|nr:ribosome-associated translation inhibitor RaiA [bacterium]